VDFILTVAETAHAVDSVMVGVSRLEAAVYVAFGLGGAQTEYVPQTPPDAVPQYVTAGSAPEYPTYLEQVEHDPRVRYTGAGRRSQREYQHRRVQR